MVNGLGATPLQELYLANLRVSEVLAEKNIKVAKTLVGNYMTSIAVSYTHLPHYRTVRWCK